jgi:endo-1,4-beta-xylanase
MTSTINRRCFIKNVGCLGIGALIASRISASLPAVGFCFSDIYGPLSDCAAAKGLFYGAASFRHILSTDESFTRKFIEECSILVPEWELKWDALRPTPTDFYFDTFDWLINFTQQNSMLFRGHNLVWHEALPSWFQSTVSSRNAEQILLDHIRTVVSRHAGQIHSWDVVNEPINIWDKNSDGLRSSSPWYELLGPGYIDIAFRAAAKADPNATLVLNQNGTEQDSPDCDITRKDVLRLLRRMKASGTPIHALGIEAHLGGKNFRFNKHKFKAFLRNIADLDLKIIITELDVTDDNLPGEIAIRDSIIAGMYYDFLSVALSEKAVIGVLTWGLSDKYSWLTTYAPRADQLPARPLPLDDTFTRKPAWLAIARCFDNTRKRIESQ